jgi:hypothetical protein
VILIAKQIFRVFFQNNKKGIPNMSEEEKKSFWQNMKEVLYGMASHDMSRYALRTRASMEHLFILITMGDMIGVPILPPYYSLRLLPYVVPQISTWKRRLLREKDLSDAMF